jgi:hypothetical protein
MATAQVVLAGALAIVVTIENKAQHMQPNAWMSGCSALSPSVVATYEGRGQMPDGPMLVDLVVLWRGSPGWYDESTDSAEVGGSSGAHRIRSRTGLVEIRFDSSTRVVQVHGNAVPLQNNNVLLLDDVDGSGGVKIAGMLRVDPPVRPTSKGGQNVDVIDAVVQQSSELFEYLRCDARFARPDDPQSQIQLRHCEQLRTQR